ncbi:hypothetical protein ABZ897_15780 [Nonomuraea sp. NPDC046802]|uniref:hypothetical protein n=1 Tax=Nonomuraea sp. NPDC046802 TaxID=3154919 RepID=UPI0033E0C9D5
MPPRTRKQAAADPAEETLEVVPAPEPAGPAPLTPPDEPEQPDEVDTADEEPVTDAAPLAPPEGRKKSAPVIDEPVTPPAPPALLGQESGLDLRRADGTPVDPDDMFEDLGARYTYVIARYRVLEHFRYAGATRDGRRVKYHAGAKVDRSEADAIRAALASS